MDCGQTYYMRDGFVGLLLVVVWWVACCGAVYVPIYYLLACAAVRIAELSMMMTCCYDS